MTFDKKKKEKRKEKEKVIYTVKNYMDIWTMAASKNAYFLE